MTPSRWTAYAKLLVFVILAAFLTALAGCGEEATVMDPTKIAEYNKPGTVLMETVWSAKITYPVLDINQDALVNFVLGEINAGRVTSEDEAVAAGLLELLNNPSAYLIPTTQNQSQDAETGGLGSGFIITEDGYVVTNAHVVKMSDEELKYELASTALANQVQTDLADIESGLGFSLSQDVSDKMASALISAYSTYLTMGTPKTTTQLYMGVAVPGYGTVQKGTPVETIKVGEPSPGKDVAILKVNANNLPTVKIGDDTVVREGDQAIALGYPGVATFNPLLDQSESNIKPSLTTGSVSGRKTMSGGWEVLQIDTATTHGNSGGPLFNKNGEVIGVVTFGSGQTNATTGAWEEVQGFNFAVPTSIVNEFLSQANVHPAEGALTTKYHEAMDLFDKEHYSAAKDRFKEVQEANASFPYVQDMIEQSVANINAGKDKPTSPISTTLIAVIVVIVVVGGTLALLFLVILPNRRKTATAGAGIPGAPVWPGAPGMGPGGRRSGSGAGPGMAAAAPPSGPAAPEAPAQPAVGASAGTGAAGAATPSGAAGPAAPTAPESTPEAQSGAPEAPAGEPAASGASVEHNFCNQCGQTLDPDSKFCSKCGKPV